MSSKLIFVYNANSGAINALLDSAHKIISPQTYDCKLCDLTYGVFKEDEEWLRFRESVNNTTLEFLHKDEFNKKYWSKWLPKYEFPIILSANEQDMYNDGFGSNGGLDIFMSATDFKELKTTSDLIEAIKKRLQ